MSAQTSVIKIGSRAKDSPCTSKCSQPSDCVMPIPLHSFSSRIRKRPVSSCEKYLEALKNTVR